MAKNPRRNTRKRYQPADVRDPSESRASVAVTIAWTSSVTGVVVANIVWIAAHLYLRSQPEAMTAKALEAIMLISAAVMGALSLALLAVVWRTRQLKPPQGYVVFAALVACAPVIALAIRLWL